MCQYDRRSNEKKSAQENANALINKQTHPRNGQSRYQIMRAMLNPLKVTSLRREQPISSRKEEAISS